MYHTFAPNATPKSEELKHPTRGGLPEPLWRLISFSRPSFSAIICFDQQSAGFGADCGFNLASRRQRCPARWAYAELDRDNGVTKVRDPIGEAFGNL